MSTSQALMDLWSGEIVITDSDEEESDGEREQPQPMPQGGARVTTSVRHTRSSAAAAAAETWTARTAAMAANSGPEPFPLLTFLENDFGPQMLQFLSVRRLWITRRVNRLFRRLCHQALGTVPRLVLGGQDFMGDGGSSQFFEAIDMQTLHWTRLAALPARRVDAAMVGLPGGQLVVCGGMVYDRSTSWNHTLSALVLDADGKLWTELPMINTPRSDGRLVQLYDGRLLMMGGTHIGGGPDGEDIDLASVEVYAQGSEAWGFIAPMLQPRSAFATCVMRSGEVMVAGGVIEKKKSDNTADDDGHDGGEDGQEGEETSEVYNPLTNKWTLLPRAPAACREADAGWELEDGRFCVRGRGGEKGSATRICFALSHDRRSWEEVWVNESRRGGPTAIAVRGGGCLMAGGMSPEDGTSLMTAELWDEESGGTYLLPHQMQHPRGFTFGTAIPRLGAQAMEEAD